MVSHRSSSSVSAENLHRMEEFKLDDDVTIFFRMELEALLLFMFVLLFSWRVCFA
jgi:hypothetical protein